MAIRLLFTTTDNGVHTREYPTGNSISRDPQRGYVLYDKENKILAVIGPENFLLIERLRDAEDTTN